jgi:hypothetical protein
MQEISEIVNHMQIKVFMLSLIPESKRTGKILLQITLAAQAHQQNE